MTDFARHFLPYQRRWIDADAPFAIGEKSRRIGWTYASAFRAVRRRLTRRTNLYYTSADLTAAREFIDECLRWASALNAGVKDLGLQALDERHGATAFVLRFEKPQVLPLQGGRRRRRRVRLPRRPARAAAGHARDGHGVGPPVAPVEHAQRGGVAVQPAR
jgi:hypothetical protein